MAKAAMDSHSFETLLARINQQTHLTDEKLHILFNSKGYFSALQAARILYAFGSSADKLKAIEIMEPRMCRMTGSEARDIIGAFNIHADKVKALEYIKRYLADSQSVEGKANVVSAFPFEDDKYKALNVLQTVRSDVQDHVAAGGHQGYAALGGLYTQSRPLVPHLYGSIEEQREKMPGQGRIALPVEAQPGVVPSMYTGHPSYAFPGGRDYAEDRGYPGNSAYAVDTGSGECPGRPPLTGTYAMDGPSGLMHPGGPHPTGFEETTTY